MPNTGRKFIGDSQLVSADSPIHSKVFQLSTPPKKDIEKCNTHKWKIMSYEQEKLLTSEFQFIKFSAKPATKRIRFHFCLHIQIKHAPIHTVVSLFI